MAMIFCDSFDHYATADILQKWSAQGTTTSQAISAGNGRRATNSWRASSNNRLMNKIVASAATYVMGFSFKPSGLPGAVSTFASFLEGATVHVTLRLNADGSVTVARNTTALGTSAVGLITAGSTHYIEIKATVHDTTGAYEVRIDGANVLSGTGADTRNGATGVITAVQIEGYASNDLDFDDFYVLDTTGSAPYNDFIGDVRVDCAFMSGNGNSSQLVGSDSNSVDNYLLVDEASQDGDTTYVQSATATEKDTYACGNMSHTPATIYGVQITAIAKKDDAGARSIATVTRSGGSDHDGSTVALTTAYFAYSTMQQENPDGPTAWTKTSFDAAEFGVKVAA